MNFRNSWKNFACGILVSVFVGSSSLWAATPLQLPVPKVETLPNGLKLVWFLNESLPLIDIALVVQAGFRDDPVGKSGMVELITSLLDRGSQGASPQEMNRSIELLGGGRTFGAEEDSTSIGLHGLVTDASALLELLGKIALYPDFLDSEMKRQRSRFKDRWNHLEDLGEGPSYLAYRRVLAAGTSYGRGMSGLSKEIGTIQREDLVAFHKKYFTPGNSALVIVGRVDPVAFKQNIVSVFGSWQGNEPERNWKNFADPRLALKKAPANKIENDPPILVVHRTDLNQAQVRMGFPIPLITSPDHDAWMVANTLLGEFFNSRLNSLVRDRWGLTYSIRSNIIYKKGWAEFTVSSSAPHEKCGQLVRKVMDVLYDLKKGPILASEVQAAKEYINGGFRLSHGNLNVVASHWLGATYLGLSPDYLNSFVSLTDSVTLESVQAAVAKNIDFSNMKVVLSGDADVIQKSLQSSRYHFIKRVSVTDLE